MCQYLFIVPLFQCVHVHPPHDGSGEGRMSLVRNEGGDDVLNLAYAPYKKRTGDRSAAVPKPLIDDEAEFENELYNKCKTSSSSVSAPGTAIDASGGDEFDFDEVSGAVEEQVQALTAALLTKYSSESGCVESVSTDELIDRSIEALMPKEDFVCGDEHIQQRGDVGAAFDLKQAARESLGAIRFQYERGLDDQSIADSKKQLKDGSAASVTVNKDMTVILEGDEEEEDSAIGVKATTASSNYAAGAATTAEELALQEEWVGLDIEPPPPQQAVGPAITSSPLKPPKPSLKNPSPNESTNDAAILLPPPPPSSSSSGDDLVSYEEALKYLRSLDLSRFDEVIVTDSSSSSSSSLGGLMTLIGLKKKEKNTTADFAFIFKLAQLDYDPTNRTMLRVLRSVFWSLAGGREELLPMGAHWERIGFQGSDPRTDINRSMKMLAVLQAARLAEQDRALSQLLYGLSIDKGRDAKLDQSWPFVCVSIMFTKEAVQALRSGVLHKRCNKCGSSLEVIHNLYKACFYSFARLLQSDRPTVHHAVHLSAVRARVGRDAVGVLDEFESSAYARQGE